LLIKDLINEARGAFVGDGDLFKIAEVVAGPFNPAPKAIGGSKALSDSRYRFGENLPAAWASETTFKDFQKNPRTSDRMICDLDPSSIMNRFGGRGALGADFEFRGLNGLIVIAVSGWIPAIDEFQVWQKNKIVITIPLGHG
jgi:hypothetical protein